MDHNLLNNTPYQTRSRTPSLSKQDAASSSVRGGREAPPRCARVLHAFSLPQSREGDQPQELGGGVQVEYERATDVVTVASRFGRIFFSFASYTDTCHLFDLWANYP